MHVATEIAPIAKSDGTYFALFSVKLVALSL